jgi:hypothetical protein
MDKLEDNYGKWEDVLRDSIHLTFRNCKVIYNDKKLYICGLGLG